MALFDFQMVKGFRKGTWFIFGFYSSHISQKVSRPWEGLQPIFRFWKWCFTQKCWGVRQKLNLKNRLGRRVTNVSAVDRACHRVGAHTSRGHCSCTVDLSSTFLAGLAFSFCLHTMFTLRTWRNRTNPMSTFQGFPSHLQIPTVFDPNCSEPKRNPSARFLGKIGSSSVKIQLIAGPDFLSILWVSFCVDSFLWCSLSFSTALKQCRLAWKHVPSDTGILGVWGQWRFAPLKELGSWKKNPKASKVSGFRVLVLKFWRIIHRPQRVGFRQMFITDS